MRLLITLGLTLLAGGAWAQHGSSERRFTQSRISTGVRNPISFRNDVGVAASGSACNPTPCGPNTRCEVTRNGIARCRCIDGMVPDDNTIDGCKPQCTSNGECGDTQRCQAQKCVAVCREPGACGENANCVARNHRAECSCPANFRGRAEIRCDREEPVIIPAAPAPPIDLCAPGTCGINADCRVRGDRPVCTCPIGFEGDPLVNCIRGECIDARDCPSHLTCRRLRCIDPCEQGICGLGAQCAVRNHQPVCSCPRNMVGDPFTRCRPFDPQELCNPSPCGANTNCRVGTHLRDATLDTARAICSCIENYIGNPLTGCRPECVSDSECPQHMGCRNNICVNPCRDACGEGAYCDVVNSRAVCSCPQYYQGDPYTRCYAECTAHEDCPDFQACYQLQCVNPCEGACGTGANCKVEDHKPICSCPRGFTGHPFESCRPFRPEDLCTPNPCGDGAVCTPGFDRSGQDRPVCTCPEGFIGNPLSRCRPGECRTSLDCQRFQSCHNFVCINPCVVGGQSVCGTNAECKVNDDKIPVCSCPPGYAGNPLSSCVISASTNTRSRFTVGRSRK